jgi:hypothetical protein
MAPVVGGHLHVGSQTEREEASTMEDVDFKVLPWLRLIPARIHLGERNCLGMDFGDGDAHGHGHSGNGNGMGDDYGSYDGDGWGGRNSYGYGYGDKDGDGQGLGNILY